MIAMALAADVEQCRSFLHIVAHKHDIGVSSAASVPLTPIAMPTDEAEAPGRR